MSYLVGAYAFAIALIAGYVLYLVRQAGTVEKRIGEVESDRKEVV